MGSLEIKNYDNFKDLSYFIGQHKKALGMMDEVQNFYLSFLKSKLVNPNAISKWPGKLIRKNTKSSWQLYLSSYTRTANIPANEIKKLVKEDRVSDLIGRKVTIDLKKEDDVIEKSATGTISKIDKVQNFYGGGFRVTGKIDLKKPIDFYDHVISYRCSCSEYVNSSYVLDSIEQLIRKKIMFNWKEIRSDFKHVYENPNLQEKFKEIVETNAKKQGINDWYIEDPKTQDLLFFSHDDQLDKYKFEIGKNPNDKKDKKEYLIITKSWKTSGNETDQWKTFYREYMHTHGIMFDTLNGNFAGFISKKETLVNRQLKVSNGWHPFDDD
jgi:hypothetical protein